MARPLLWLGALALVTVSVSSCAVLAWVAPLYGAVSNFADPACSQSFSTELIAALKQQGETPEDAADAAGRAVRTFSREGEPEHFLAASSSGVSYWFDFEPKRSGCMLRLYGRQKGDTTEWNTMTYYAKRQMAACTCKWNLVSESSSTGP
jgi:hypothetical protein